MLVSQILKSKTAGMIHVTPETKVSEAAAILSERRIGALIVSSDGVHCHGILSERDIVRELGKRGPAVLDEQLSSIMTAKVIGCVSGDTTINVLQRMTDGRFRHMPVLDGDRVVAVISLGDVVKARLEELAAEKDALEGMIKGY